MILSYRLKTLDDSPSPADTTMMAGEGCLISCEHYEAGVVIEDQNVLHNHLLFALDGSAMISLSSFCEFHLREGEMLLVPAFNSFQLSTCTDVKMLDMVFNDLSGDSYREFLLKHYTYDPSHLKNTTPVVLPVRVPLDTFLQTILFCLESGKGSNHMCKLKLEEFFCILSSFYPHSEVYSLVAAVIKRRNTFKETVYKLQAKVNTSAEMIRLSGMEKGVFIRRFKEEFHQSPHRWVHKNVCDRIMNDVLRTEMSVKEIMFNNGFSSYSNFNRFCKKNLGATPHSLLKKYRKVH